jgi:hypothetical protein
MIAMLLLLLQLSDTRHAATVRAFERLTGFPHGRPGWVVDHEIPLCAGGPDVTTNMAWQEVKASYVKDQFERKLCVAMKTQGYVLVPVKGKG